MKNLTLQKEAFKIAQLGERVDIKVLVQSGSKSVPHFTAVFYVEITLFLPLRCFAKNFA